MKKRIISLLLASLIIIGLLSGTVSAELVSNVSAIINVQNSPPSDDFEKDTSNPYGLSADSDEPVLMLKEHEVFLLKTTKRSSDLGPENGIYCMEYSLPSSFKTNVNGTKYSSQDLDAVILGRSSANRGSKATSEINSNKHRIYDYSDSIVLQYYSRLAAIDPDGDGRDEYVAQLYVNYGEKDDKEYIRACLRILNPCGKNLYEIPGISTTEVATMKWIGSNGFAQAKLNNYLSIVGGDFDGDGKDEVAVCVTGDDETLCLKVYDVEFKTKDLQILTVDYAEPKEIASLPGKRLCWDKNGDDECDKLTCSLAAGDLDGIAGEELVVCAGTNYRASVDEYEDTIQDRDKGFDMDNNTSNITTWTWSSSKNDFEKLHDWSAAEETGSGKNSLTYSAIHSGAVSVGDVDGDKENEIVLTGYLSTITVTTLNDGSGKKERTGLYDYNESAFGVAIIEPDLPDGNLEGISEVTQTALIHGGFHMDYSNDDYVMPLLINECVAVNGMTAPELVFVGGSFYSLSGGSPKLVYTVES